MKGLSSLIVGILFLLISISSVFGTYLFYMKATTKLNKNIYFTSEIKPYIDYVYEINDNLLVFDFQYFGDKVENLSNFEFEIYLDNDSKIKIRDYTVLKDKYCNYYDGNIYPGSKCKILVDLSKYSLSINNLSYIVPLYGDNFGFGKTIQNLRKLKIDDDVKPKIDIYFPTNNSLINNQTILVKLSIYDDNLRDCWYTLNSTKDYFNCEDFILDNLSSTYYNLTIYARDIFGNLNNKTIFFKIDYEPPRILLSKPDKETYSTLVPVSLNVSDSLNTSCLYNIDEKENHSIECNFERAFAIDKGLHTLNFYAVDEAGNINKTSKRINITVPLREDNYKLSLFTYHTCFINSTNLYCWGANDDGQLGVGDNIDRNVPTLVSGMSGKDMVSLVDWAHEYTLISLANGSIYSWGKDAEQQLGTSGSTTNTPAYADLISNKNFEALSAGYHHVCAFNETGTYCWGANWCGELGAGLSPGSCTCSSLEWDPEYGTPKKVVGIPDTEHSIDLDADGYGHYALTDAGHVYYWGRGCVGQAGNGNISATFTTAQKADIENIVQIDASGTSVCALKNDSTIWCWGSNTAGQLGLGYNSSFESYPKHVVDLDGKRIRKLIASHSSFIAISEDGKIYVWGSNYACKLGTGDENPCNTTINDVGVCLRPHRNKYLESFHFVLINCGSNHCCGLTEDNHVYCWGLNNRGQLGTGDTTNRCVPTKVI